ncbi:granzyme A-like [Elephas maximus indicus]|uniref:granzyme A-like n=1 Tax=Elephas maximus indicus TaxID=99487 RepID=UPI0021165B1B|nr:granzyme A-like [Elephas maximus indicus]
MKFFFPFSFFTASFLLLILGVFSEPHEGITGGYEEARHSRPYLALLKGSNNCAGALIKENWVLTAARCQLENRTQIFLGAGSIFHKKNHKQIFSIKKNIIYPCYDSLTSEGDLQLLQLDGRATITKDVGILQLPKTGEDVKPHTKCHVAEWRSTRKNPKGILDTLREVNVTVTDQKICKDEKYYNFKSVIDKTRICAIGKKGENDACRVNAGSPLICGNIFRGVTSFGKCCNPQKPGVYTALTTNYLNWIRKTIGGAI